MIGSFLLVLITFNTLLCYYLNSSILPCEQYANLQSGIRALCTSEIQLSGGTSKVEYSHRIIKDGWA